MKNEKANIWVVLLCIIGFGSVIGFIGKSIKTTKGIKLANQVNELRHITNTKETNFQKVTKPIGIADKINKGANAYSATNKMSNENKGLTPEEEAELKYLERELERRRNKNR